MRTDLVVSRVFEKRLGPPFSSCRTFAAIHTESTIRFRYFQIECFVVCYNQKVLENCGLGEEFASISDAFYMNIEHFEAVKTNLTQSCDHSLVDEVAQRFVRVFKLTFTLLINFSYIGSYSRLML